VEVEVGADGPASAPLSGAAAAAPPAGAHKVAKIMDEFGVKVAKLHDTANFLLRRRLGLVYNGLDLLV
jgi:hypothetical protein